MEYSNNISTNIVRDAVDDTLIDFVATSNTKEIFKCACARDRRIAQKNFNF